MAAVERERQHWEVSSSDSEDEEESEAQARGSEPRGSGEVEEPGKMTKFKCPSEFIPCPLAELCDLTSEKVNGPSTELWLIKAPVDFDPHGFSGRKIPLVGFQTLKSKTCRDKRYNVFGMSTGAGGVCLVLPSETAGHMESCPPFAGCISIGESWEDTGGSDEPHSIPVSPAPSIPPGLKLRFQPFGATPPRQLPRKRRGAAATTPKSGDAGEEPVAKRRKGARKTAVRGHEPNHEVTGDTRRKKRGDEQEEAACEHSDTGSLELGHSGRRKGGKANAEIPQTEPCEVDLGHKKKKKKKDKR
ncbi:CD3e molecule, epsilon associated protein [Carcharodon carcharias]|uniref:CD3e molecule, epsilon associated protein n=1 Tax=Carcharodon carcharias TaxID=13397 RepID=UPI001B7E9D0E|nr:CD3e molecule, epsilon associated protein [Carcharodon carcharias]